MLANDWGNRESSAPRGLRKERLPWAIIILTARAKLEPENPLSIQKDHPQTEKRANRPRYTKGGDNENNETLPRLGIARQEAKQLDVETD